MLNFRTVTLNKIKDNRVYTLYFDRIINGTTYRFYMNRKAIYTRYSRRNYKHIIFKRDDLTKANQSPNNFVKYEHELRAISFSDAVFPRKFSNDIILNYLLHHKITNENIRVAFDYCNILWEVDIVTVVKVAV